MSSPILARFKISYGIFNLSVDVNFPGSGISVLFGPSGSGKTTLLRCIAGLQKPNEGFLKINGKIWQNSQQQIFLPTHKRSLGYVFQEANLFPHLTVADNLQFGIRRLYKSPTTIDLQHIMDVLGITHILQRYPERLSGGERQRVAIARALALNPEVLLMDEPLASLDFKRKQEIIPFIRQLQQELHIPVLYVTHSLQEVAQLADHVLILADGGVQISGSLSETQNQLDGTLAQDKEAASVWQAEIIAHDPIFQLTCVSFPGGQLDLPLIAAEIGTRIRLQIYARDVSIALEAPRASSILNILPASITGISSNPAAQTAVRLQVGTQTLLAHITRKSATLLGLKLNLTVYVQIKSTSILN